MSLLIWLLAQRKTSFFKTPYLQPSLYLPEYWKFPLRNVTTLEKSPKNVDMGFLYKGLSRSPCSEIERPHISPCPSELPISTLLVNMRKQSRSSEPSRMTRHLTKVYNMKVPESTNQRRQFGKNRLCKGKKTKKENKNYY